MHSREFTIKTQLIDLAMLQSYCDQIGLDMLAHMTNKYEAVFGGYINELSQCLNVSDDSNWKYICHKTKSAASSIGLVQVFQHVCTMELDLLSTNDKLHLIKSLEDINHHSLVQLRNWLVSKRV